MRIIKQASIKIYFLWRHSERQNFRSTVVVGMRNGVAVAKRRMFRRSARVLAVSAALFALLAARVLCFEADEEKIRWAAKEGASIHRINLKESVKTIYVEDKDDLIAVLRKDFEKEYPKSRYETLERIGEKIGFYVGKIETENDLLRMYSESIAGLYNPEDKTIHIVETNLLDRLSNEQADRYENQCGFKIAMYDDPVWQDWVKKHRNDFTLIHELTHAAQDQNFDLKAWQDQYEANTDAMLAVKSVIEGTAEYTEEAYLLEQFGAAWILDDERYDFYEIFEQMRENEKTRYADDPEDACGKDVSYQYKLSAFPYNYGMALVQRRKGKGGWNAVHKMHYDYPMSTEQVLHPDKFFDAKKLDWPTFIVPPDLYDTLPESFDFLDSDSMGEYRIYILLRDLIFEPRDAIRVSEGWDGDRYLAFNDTANGDLMFAWLSVWDSDSEAAEFFDFYKNIVDRKTIASNFLKTKENAYLTESSGQFNYVERRGKLVLAVEGLSDRGLLDKVVEKMFGAEIYEATYDDYEVLPDYYLPPEGAVN